MVEERWDSRVRNSVGMSSAEMLARMARIGVRSRSLKRSVAEWIPLNHAPWANASELTRTAAPNRQAGGHWFEPSTAHRKALHKGFLLFSRRLWSGCGKDEARTGT